MKKRFLLVALIGLIGASWAYAQDKSDNDVKFNKWSIDAGIGLNKPWRNFDRGFTSPTPGFFNGQIGARYMINEFFGMKVDFDYNRFSEKDNTPSFKTTSLRGDIQGVANLGRLMKFETWTKRIGLLGHAGFGIGNMNYDRTDISTDAYGSLLGGLTVQYKVSNRVALNVDGSCVFNVRQDRGFDGGVGNNKNVGTVFNGTVGVSFYLGHNKTHADWYYRDDVKFTKLNKRIDAVADRVSDLEDNTAKKADLNKATKKLGKRVSALENQPKPNYDDFVKQLANDGYISVYFDFKSTKVQGASANSLNFMKTYMAKHAKATIEIQGYADELGSAKYNQKLSQKRADAVVALLTKAGIDASRLSAVGKGVDSSVDKSSKDARQLARRATFIVK